MKKINLFCFLFILTVALPAAAASLFDEPDKDAAAALQVAVEKDRQMQEIENRKYIQTRQAYQNNQQAEIYARIDALEKRVSELETLAGTPREEESKS